MSFIWKLAIFLVIQDFTGFIQQLTLPDLGGGGGYDFITKFG